MLLLQYIPQWKYNTADLLSHSLNLKRFSFFPFAKLQPEYIHAIRSTSLALKAEEIKNERPRNAGTGTQS